MKLISLILTTLIATNAMASEQKTVRERVAQFFEAKVVGRTQKVSTSGTMTANGENFQIDFSATITWSDLEKTADGFMVSEKRDTKQTSTKLDAQGHTVGKPIATDRTITRRLAVSERQTTNSLVGITTVTLDSGDASTGEGFSTMIEISSDDKEVYIYESLIGFAERSLDGVNFVPVATATAATLYLNEQGKLQTDETVKFYSVDVNHDFTRKEINRFNLSATEVSP